MAKKNDKRKSSRKSLNLLSFVKFGAIAFAVVGLVMTVFAFVKYSDKLSYTGIQQIFGVSKDNLIGNTVISTTQYLSFSFMTLLAVVLPLIGSISIFFKNKIIRAIGVVIMIAGCVLTLLAPNFVVLTDMGKIVTLGVDGSLGIGAILAGIFFGVGTFCCLFSVVEDKVAK